jgi:hypothetical protein
MDDPQRLLGAGSDADALEHELLSSLRGPGPSARERAAMYTGLTAQIAAAALGASAAAGVTSVASVASAASAAATRVELGARVGTATGGMLTGKAVGAKVVALWMMGGLTLGGLTLGGSALWLTERAPRAHPAEPHRKASHEAPPSLEVPTVVVLPEASSAPDAAASQAPSPVVEPQAVRARATQRARNVVHRRAQLVRESRALTEARAALRRGDVAAARALLTRLESQQGGTLDQERKVLDIEILVAEHNRSAVERKVRAFLEAHPDSPHSARLTRYLAAP